MHARLLSFLLVASSALAATDAAQLAAAKTLFTERKFTESEAAFKKLAAADPANAELHYYLGLSIGRRSDFDAAAKVLERAVALAPQNAPYHHALGEQYGQGAQKAGMSFSGFGLARKCVAAYQRAVALDPANAGYHQSLFEYYRQAPGIVGGGTDKAEAEAAALLKLDPMRGHTAYATLYTGEKKFTQAMPHLTELKKLDANRGRLAFAALYTETKEYDKAFAEFEEVLKTTPDDYGALYQVGKLSATTGQQLDRGLVALRRCLALTPGKDQPTLAAAQWRVGNILEKKTDVAGARAAYQASLQLDPNFTNASDALKKLK